MKRNKPTNHVLKKQKQKTNNKIYFKKLDFKEKDILWVSKQKDQVIYLKGKESKIVTRLPDSYALCHNTILLSSKDIQGKEM